MRSIAVAASILVLMVSALASAEEPTPPAPVEPAKVETPAPSEPAATTLIANPDTSAPSTSTPPVVAAVIDEEKPEAKKPWKVSLSTDTSMGLGTFVSNPYSDNPLVVQSLMLSGSYSIKQLPLNPSVSLKQGLAYEYTQSDLDNGRKYDYADTRIGVSVGEIYKEPITEIALSGNFGLTLPISIASRATNKYTTLSLGANLARSIYGFDVSLGASGAKHLYKHTTVGIQPENAVASDGIRLAFCRAGEVHCIGGDHVGNFGLLVGGGVGYKILEKLALSLDLRYAMGWRRPAPKDEFTSKETTVDGRPVAKSARDITRTKDSVISSLSASYDLNDYLAFSLAMGTEGPVRTADSKSFRNPFFDTISPANNLTSFSVGATATY